MTIVRVPKHDEVSLVTALDAGAAGLIIPHVESAQEVKDFIKEIYYRKLQARSVSCAFVQENAILSRNNLTLISARGTSFILPMDIHTRSYRCLSLP